jgi:hypothetical protein
MVAIGAVIQGLLCGSDLIVLAVPDVQSRVLDGAGEREHQRPGRSSSTAPRNEVDGIKPC